MSGLYRVYYREYREGHRIKDKWKLIASFIFFDDAQAWVKSETSYDEIAEHEFKIMRKNNNVMKG